MPLTRDYLDQFIGTHPDNRPREITLPSGKTVIVSEIKAIGFQGSDSGIDGHDPTPLDFEKNVVITAELVEPVSPTQVTVKHPPSGQPAGSSPPGKGSGSQQGGQPSGTSQSGNASGKQNSADTKRLTAVDNNQSTIDLKTARIKQSDQGKSTDQIPADGKPPEDAAVPANGQPAAPGPPTRSRPPQADDPGAESLAEDFLDKYTGKPPDKVTPPAQTSGGPGDTGGGIDPGLQPGQQANLSGAGNQPDGYSADSSNVSGSAGGGFDLGSQSGQQANLGGMGNQSGGYSADSSNVSGNAGGGFDLGSQSGQQANLGGAGNQSGGQPVQPADNYNVPGGSQGAQQNLVKYVNPETGEVRYVKPDRKQFLEGQDDFRAEVDELVEELANKIREEEPPLPQSDRTPPSGEGQIIDGDELDSALDDF